MNEISLKSYCKLFNLPINDNIDKPELITILSSFTANKHNDDTLLQNTESMDIIEQHRKGDTENLFGFQMDADRLDCLLIAKEEMDEKLIEIDDKKNHFYINIQLILKVMYHIQMDQILHLKHHELVIYQNQQ